MTRAFEMKLDGSRLANRVAHAHEDWRPCPSSMWEDAIFQHDLTRSVAADLVRRGLAGVAIGLRLADGQSSLAAAGLADIGHGTLMMPEHQFRIASISKLFVFAALLRLQETGVLDIEQPISRWIPDLPYAESVTLRHILTQTGGLPVWATDLVTEIPDAEAWPPRQVIDYHYARTPAQPPGGPMVYANVGSRVAGLIAELASGEPLAALIDRLFLLPLKLGSTVPSGAVRARPRQLARGYAFGDAAVAPVDVTWAVPQAWLWSGGDMYSSVDDLTRWAEALFSGAVLGPEMTRAQLTEWFPGGFHGSTMSHHGLGIMVFSQGDVRALGYRGTTPGYVSILGYDPSTGASAAILTNSFSPDPWSFYRSGVEIALFRLLGSVRTAPCP